MNKNEESDFDRLLSTSPFAIAAVVLVSVLFQVGNRAFGIAVGVVGLLTIVLGLWLVADREKQEAQEDRKEGGEDEAANGGGRGEQ